MRIGANCHHTLKGISSTAIFPRSFRDVGGFAPPCNAHEGVELVREAFETARYKDKSKIGMNIAASRFEVEGQDCSTSDWYTVGKWMPRA